MLNCTDRSEKVEQVKLTYNIDSIIQLSPKLIG